MHSFDVVILTESRYINPVMVNDYINNVLTEEYLFQEALEKWGLTVIRKDWADPDFDWSSTKCAIFRSTWDYFNRFEIFKGWLSKVETQTKLINPISQVRWNMDKWYLSEFAEKGIPVVETQYLKKGTKGSLKSIFENSGWEEVILKPTVAGTARHTYRLNLENIDSHEEIFSSLIISEDLMLQPFQYNILEKGEISMVLIGGEYTHSVLKKGKEGEFRVQDDFGGTLHDYEPSKEEIVFAEEVVKACSPIPLYARVDIMWDNNNELIVSEIELIEPELWFRRNPTSAEKLAELIKKNLD